MAQEDSTPKSRVIVLLHGFAAHWALMTRFQKYFRAAGHRTVNWGYRSWFRPIDYHGSRLREKILELEADESVQTIDFVTHSMGCVVTRAALQQESAAKLGRWVMLAPPNQGSYVANSVPRTIRRVFRPVDQLRAQPDSYVNQLPMPSGIEVGIVQAEADFIVAEELTRIAQESDRRLFPGLHSQLLFRQDVWEESLHFLYHGEFRGERSAIEDAETQESD